ncbi:RNA binding protein [Trifolium repens]|nr:RNA binding protein [Trifolium repens]
MGRKGDGQPSDILWIGYPPNYSFVEFRSVDEARCAKEGLQGRLFNDPRIAINFSNGDQGHGKDYPGFYPGSNWPRPDLFVNEHSYRPLQMDLFGHNRPMVPNNFPGHLPTGGIVGPNIQMRPFGPQSGPESVVSGPEFNENSTLHKFQEGSSANKMGSNWKRPSPPAPGLLSSPVPGAKLPARSTSSAWDVLDGHPWPASMRNTGGVHSSVQPGGLDHIWRGLIAKGGTPVCRARCVPVGKGIGTELFSIANKEVNSQCSTMILKPKSHGTVSGGL